MPSPKTFSLSITGKFRSDTTDFVMESGKIGRLLLGVTCFVLFDFSIEVLDRERADDERAFLPRLDALRLEEE